MPDGVTEGILKGMYRVRESSALNNPVSLKKSGSVHRQPAAGNRPQLLASGPILREALRAQEILIEKFGVLSDVWSVTSYKELRRDALAAERWNLRHPGEEQRVPYVQQCLKDSHGPIIAASDYMRLVAEQIARWMPEQMIPLGTDGFGRSDTRQALRRHFEVDAEHITFAALAALYRQGKLDAKALRKAMTELTIDPEKEDPVLS